MQHLSSFKLSAALNSVRQQLAALDQSVDAIRRERERVALPAAMGNEEAKQRLVDLAADSDRFADKRQDLLDAEAEARRLLHEADKRERAADEVQRIRQTAELIRQALGAARAVDAAADMLAESWAGLRTALAAAGSTGIVQQDADALRDRYVLDGALRAAGLHEILQNQMADPNAPRAGAAVATRLRLPGAAERLIADA